MRGRPKKVRSPEEAGDVKSPAPLKSKPLRVTLPTPPDILSDAGKEEWYRIVSKLSDEGVLSSADLGLLTIACLAFEAVLQSVETFRKDGLFYVTLDSKGNVKAKLPHPTLQTFFKAADTYRQSALLFGLSTFGRARIGLDINFEDGDEGDISDVKI